MWNLIVFMTNTIQQSSTEYTYLKRKFEIKSKFYTLRFLFQFKISVNKEDAVLFETHIEISFRHFFQN